MKDSSKLCAPAPGLKWQGRHLFAQTAPGKLGLNGTLATYCVYHWSDNTTVPTPADVAQLPPLLPRARDRRAITPQGTVEAWAHDTFLAGIHGPAQSTPAVGSRRVRVIIADTEQDSVGAGNGSTTLGTNVHGARMADLVRDLVACPTPDACAVEVETRLALPLHRTSLNAEEPVSTGGDFGRLSDLVGAIDRSLKDWRTAILTGKPFPPMLALSLSLAFEKQTAIPAGEDFSADDVVLDALKAFSCHGGAIFAAAGNHGGQGSKDLLYPAAWQTELEPTAPQCALLFDTKTDDGYGTLNKLYSAGLGGKLPLRRA